MVDPKCEEGKNKNGQSPHQLFDEKHKMPIKEVEKWSKEIITSFLIVSILIITIIFPGLLTILGGND